MQKKIVRILVPIFLIICASFDAQAQVKEINPNVQWRFVRSQQLDLVSGSFYSFEFPAESGYDYVFNLAHNQNGVFATISIFDMQDKPIQNSILDNNAGTMDLNFDVPASGTYKVLVGIRKTSAKEGEIYPSHFTLVRRLKV
ncbi:MAG: hypothetical protein ACI8ZN_001108 [Bacteroidia bacterium]|jgi:hypothetical protein